MKTKVFEFVLFGLCALLVWLTLPANAGVGLPDTGNIYQNVGAMLVEYVPTGDIFFYCSGVLVAPTVFLTAGHCTAGLDQLFPSILQLYVTFQPNALDPWPPAAIAVTSFFRDPRFGRDFGDLHDLAVLTLPVDSTTGITPAELPSLGRLGQMAAKGGLRGVNFEHAGYGVVPLLAFQGGPPQFSYDGWRRYAFVPFMALNRNWLKLLMNIDATAEGGVCYGDSGSPQFLLGESTVVALTSWGDMPCRALDSNYRLDTPSAWEFFQQVETQYEVELVP